MRVRFAAVPLALAGLISVSCGGVIDPSKNTVDTFNGTLVPGGAAIVQKLDVRNNGEFSVKITALSPTPTAIMGLEWDFGANCDVPVQRNNFATLNQPALGGLVQQKGAYCVVAFESVALATPLNFTVTISHP